MREVCNAQWDDIQNRLREKDAEIERLKSWNQTLKQIVADDPEKHFLKVLLARAADALEDFRSPREQSYLSDSDLIAELRKGALIDELKEAAK